MRVEDPELITAVKGLWCLACGRTPCDAHHVTTRGAGGGDTPENLMPLCRAHHAEWHQVGPWAMVKRYPAVGHWLREAGRDDIFARIARHTHEVAQGSTMSRESSPTVQTQFQEPITDLKCVLETTNLNEEIQNGIEEETSHTPC